MPTDGGGDSVSERVVDGGRLPSGEGGMLAMGLGTGRLDDEPFIVCVGCVEMERMISIQCHC